MKVIDLHCDTLYKLLKDKEQNLYDNNFHISIKKLIEGNYSLQCFACFVPLTVENPLKMCLEMINTYNKEIKRNIDYIEKVLSYDDIIKNINNNKISSMLTIEEGGVLLGSLDVLDILYTLGVRMMTLTWNYENEIAYPNYGNYINGKPDFVTPNKIDGLKSFGIKLVERLNELGIIIDVSHLSDKGFYDVIKYSKKPIVASHSNSRVICNHVRNLTDDMILKLKENNGIMGINYYNQFVNKEEEMTYVADLVKHIKHIVSIAGVEVIALGSDFDGIEGKFEISDCSKIHILYNELKKDFDQNDINKMFYENALRVFKEVLR